MAPYRAALARLTGLVVVRADYRGDFATPILGWPERRSINGLTIFVFRFALEFRFSGQIGSVNRVCQAASVGRTGVIGSTDVMLDD